MKIFEDQQRKQGMPSFSPSVHSHFSLVLLTIYSGKVVNHQFAKEMLVGIAGAEVDKLFETKGLDFLDKEKAKRHAEKQAEHLYDQQYSQYDQYDP